MCIVHCAMHIMYIILNIEYYLLKNDVDLSVTYCSEKLKDYEIPADGGFHISLSHPPEMTIRPYLCKQGSMTAFKEVH